MSEGFRASGMLTWTWTLIKDDVAECALSFHDHHSTVFEKEEHSARKMYLSFIRMTFIKEGV
jgi:hypothetical protein